MTQKKNYYEILGIHPKSTIKQIKMAFKAQIRTHHPDKNISTDTNKIDIPNSSNKMNDKKEVSMKIIEAYQCLIDPQKRKVYDHQLYSESLKSQLFSVRHKDTISLSTKEKQNNNNNQSDFSQKNNQNQNLGQQGKVNEQKSDKESLEDIDSDEQDEQDFTTFVCQQCFGQMQIPNNELEQLHSKQLSINCRHCGLYMTVVQ